MGAWSAKLFADDTAQDVRDEWIEVFRATASAAKATRAVRSEYRDTLADPDEGPVATLALAMTMWKYGCLSSTARNAALRVIANKKGLSLWREQGAAAERARLKEYQRIKLVLESPQPATKQGTFKPIKQEDCGLQVGDVFSVPLPPSDGGRGYFRVAGMDKDTRGQYPVVQLLDVPPEADASRVNWAKAATVGIRNHRNPLGVNARFKAEAVSGWLARGFDRAGVLVHGRVEIATQVRTGTINVSSCDWKVLWECVRPSLDSSTWLTPQDVLDQCLAQSLRTMGALRSTIEMAGRRTGDLRAYSTAVVWRLVTGHGEYEKALALLDLAVSIDPDLESDEYRGHALFGMGRTEEAEQLWRNALRVDEPRRQWVQKAINDARAAVEARRAGNPIRTAANFYFG